MIVVVKDVISKGKYGGAIFSATCSSDQTYKMIADWRVAPRPPLKGEVWEVEGVTRVHHRFGPQVHLSKAALKRPSGQLFIKTVSMSDRFPGIGSAIATGLYALHQEEIYELLDKGDPSAFESIGTQLARVLVDGWKDMAGTADVYQWLDKQGITVSLANKLIALYGNDAAQLLEENPYRLLAFTSWEVAERIARGLEIPKEDPRRLIAGADETVFAELKNKNTWTPLADFLKRVQKVLRCDPETSKRALELAEADKVIVKVKGGIQGLGAWSMESFILERIKDLLSGKFNSKQTTIRSTPSPAELEIFFTEFEQANQIKLNAGQKKAVEMALTAPIGILCGGAGVGKTTVLKAVCEATEKFGGQVILEALAGRAARRMTEATNREAVTIARFLKQVAQEKISLEDGLSTIAVDESSMVDLPTMYRIMRRMGPGCRLLLIGDPCQLPPISFGLIFHILARSPLVPRVELTEIMRQAASTGIPQFSSAIRPDLPAGAKRQIPEIKEYCGKQDGVYFLECSSEQLHQNLATIAKDLNQSRFDKLRFITPLKGETRPDGALAINEMFYRELAAGRQPERDGFALYEPVLWNENDYDLELMNGTLGFVSGVSDGIEVAWEVGHLKMDSIDNMERAYAINCHRCQGSQFERVIIPLFKSKILDSTMLYTAVTRAQRQVVLVGDFEAFRSAVMAPSKSSLRLTGLQLRLEELKTELDPKVESYGADQRRLELAGLE